MRALFYDPNTPEVTTGGAELVSRWQANPDSILWADFETVSAAQRRELLEEAFGLHPRLRPLKRIFTYHGLVIAALRREEDHDINARFGHELNDVDDQVKRCDSLAELYYQLASDLVDAYLGTSAHRLNQIMQVLTVITVIFVPLSFLAGIYGMNFENMPELQSRSGYFILLAIMASVVGLQLFVFRRKRWL